MNQFIALIYGLILVFVLTGCERQINVKIGVVAPMTGPLAQYGKDIAQGAMIAADELNNSHFLIHGRTAHFELVVEDDKALPEEGKAAAQRLIDAGVVAVLGHFNSGVSMAAAPLYAYAEIPQMSTSTNPKYTRMGLKTTFRITADDIKQGETLGRLISDKLKGKSIFLVDDGSAFGLGLAEEVNHLLKVKNILAPRESIDPDTPDFSDIVQKIKSKQTDVVFFGGDQVVGIPLLKKLRKSSLDVKFVAGDGMCDITALKVAKGAADNNYYCTMAGVPPSWLSSGAGFLQMYQAKFGQPGAFSSLAYDSIHIFAQAMQRAQSIKPKNILAELSEGSFDGKIQGAVEFDAKGDVKDGTVVVYEAIAGKFQELR